MMYFGTHHEPLIITRRGKTQAHDPAPYNRENEPRLSWEELEASSDATAWGPRILAYRVEFVSSTAKSYSRLDPVLQRRDPPADQQPGGRQRPRSGGINNNLARRLN
jgi:hypothetical protein